MCRVNPYGKSSRRCNECHAKTMQQWRKEHPLSEAQKFKDIARSYANVYKRRGKIQQQPCVKCGDEKSQMHHEDYSKPLDVIWLCRSCHLAEHKVHKRTD